MGTNFAIILIPFNEECWIRRFTFINSAIRRGIFRNKYIGENAYLFEDTIQGTATLGGVHTLVCAGIVGCAGKTFACLHSRLHALVVI